MKRQPERITIALVNRFWYNSIPHVVSEIQLDYNPWLLKKKKKKERQNQSFRAYIAVAQNHLS